MKLNKQEQKVYNFIRDHRGATTKDIERELGITCPSARITYLRDKDVNIKSIGQKDGFTNTLVVLLPDKALPLQRWGGSCNG
jgi:Helix-turn-helix domain